MECKQCALHEHACNVVMGRGGEHASVMLIGEAPGFEEDMSGEAFTGKAGQLLNYVLDKLQVPPDEVFITNCLRCKPQGNKPPSPKVVLGLFQQCEHHLVSEIRSVKPKILVLMGSTPLYVIGHKVHVTQCEGTLLPTQYMNKPLMVSYHPAFILRQPSKEVFLARAIWSAFKHIGKMLPPPKRSNAFFGYDKEDII